MKPLGTNPSKQEEIEWLRAVMSKIPRGTYLESLLSEQLMQWFIGRVNEDVCPDVMGAMDFAKVIATHDLANEVVKLKKEIDDLNAANNRLASKNVELNNRAEEFSEELDARQSDLSATARDLQSLQGQFDYLRQYANTLEAKAKKWDMLSGLVQNLLKPEEV